MASVKSLQFVIALSLMFIASCTFGHPLRTCKFERIYHLGDSVSVRGVVDEAANIEALTTLAQQPYGVVFNKNATTRCSDGLVMNDRVANLAGLPLIPPYYNADADFTHGASFAVAGSTALPYEVLMEKRIIYSKRKSSLGMQLDTMDNHLSSICPNDNYGDCFEKLHSALFVVEETGLNDYSYAIFEGKSVEELKLMVPDVVKVIIHAVKKVIDLGATRVVVPGSYPIGCLPVYQTAFKGQTDWDQCLTKFNDFSKYHNEQLQQAIHKLKQEKPNAIIIYGDYYNAYQRLLHYARSQAFRVHCEDSHGYVNWDALHLTDRAYKLMANQFSDDIFRELQCH